MLATAGRAPQHIGAIGSDIWGGAMGAVPACRHWWVRSPLPQPSLFMEHSIYNRWILLIDVPDDFSSSQRILFNESSGRSFIRSLGGRSSVIFTPRSLSCTTQFFDLIRGARAECAFEGRKFPLMHQASRASINMRFRLYGKNLLAMEVERTSPSASTIEDLLAASSLWDDVALGALVLDIIGLVRDPRKGFSPAAQRPKAYRCIRIISPASDVPSDAQLVELLTGHRAASPMVVADVLRRNRSLRVDASTLLVDRQGVVASFPNSLADDQTAARRFIAASNMLELIACIERMLEKQTLKTLSQAELADIATYFREPKRRFLHSTSSRYIWRVLAAEFGLQPARWASVDPTRAATASPTDWVRRASDWARSKKMIAAVIVVAAVVVALISVGQKVRGGLADAAAALRSIRRPPVPADLGRFLFSDSQGLHFLLKNDSASSAFITGAELEVRSFKITQQLIANDGLPTTSNAGQDMPGHRFRLDRVTRETEIRPEIELEYVFAIPTDIPYSGDDETLIVAGGSCVVTITWTMADSHPRQLTQVRPCKDLAYSFPALAGRSRHLSD
jgi:hypothetical protein